MNWFRENRFLSAFLISFGICAVGAIWFLFNAKGNWNEASTRLNQAVAELNRLERLAPYPSADNLGKMKAHAAEYEAALAKVKDELVKRVPPVPPMAPNVFQSHLRVAMTGIAEKARANGVKLPDRFTLVSIHLHPRCRRDGGPPARARAGADRVASSYCAGGTGGGLISFRRARLPEEKRGARGRAQPCLNHPKPVERNVVEMTLFQRRGGEKSP